MRINGFNFRDVGCIVNGIRKESCGSKPAVNLYVVVTRQCNASCKFCTFRGSCATIDIDKFRETIDYILSFCDIDTVHFTGGEPSFNIGIIQEICKIVKNRCTLIKTSCNTNGIYLEELGNIEELDNIALSRHSVHDIENFELFRTDSVPDLIRLQDFKYKDKLHLSCNLIKGYIDSKSRVLEYLDFAGDIVGCCDVGFVGLMSVNEWCKNYYIEMPSMDGVFLSRHSEDVENNILYCKCSNWLYQTKELHFVSAYYRHVLCSRSDGGCFVYENNLLRQG